MDTNKHPLKKVAIWIRVSTDEQNTDNQLFQLQEFCNRRNWEIVEVYDLTGISAYRNAHEKYLRTSKSLFRPSSNSVLVADISKAKKDFNFEPKTNFKELVNIMVASDLEEETD